MSQSKYPSTEEESNWTVAVFKCPRKNWTETLTKLYSELDKQGLSLTPHYTIRPFYDPFTDSLMISFRILRQKEDESAIKSLLENFLKDYPVHEIDPKESSPLHQYHAWIAAEWTENECVILSSISRFVLGIIRSDTSLEDKEEWIHLFSNMAGVFDLLKVYRSPETMLNPDQRYIDTVVNYFPKIVFPSELK